MLNRRVLMSGTAGLAVLLSLSGAQAWSWGNERVAGSGQIVSETRELGAFDAVALSGNFKVLVRQSGSARFELKGDSNLLPLIETKVVEGGKGRTLEISAKRGYNLAATVTPQVTLDMPELRSVAISGSGEIRVEAMKAAAVDASIAGSGDIKIVDANIEQLGLRIAGSGDILATGRSASLSVSLSGSGTVKARGLESEEAKVSIAGSGNAQVHAIKKLNVSISGSGDVGYAGSPEVSTSIAGSGSVRKF